MCLEEVDLFLCDHVQATRVVFRCGVLQGGPCATPIQDKLITKNIFPQCQPLLESFSKAREHVTEKDFIAGESLEKKEPALKKGPGMTAWSAIKKVQFQSEGKSNAEKEKSAGKADKENSAVEAGKENNASEAEPPESTEDEHDYRGLHQGDPET
ncbi:hypothetical protein MMC12_000594 [Toensbergia leucococca]|nr:hypothetical protein [Toensbergia leucococca]